METTRRAAVGERLPALTLEPVAGRPGHLQRTRHGTSVLLAPHLGCRGCWAYIDRIGEFAARFDAWSAGVLLLGGDADDAEALAERGWAVVLPDADGRARPALGQAADEAVVVADRFGTVYRSASAGKGHELPEPGDLFEEVRYMGSLCPECGVPDDRLAGEESRGR